MERTPIIVRTPIFEHDSEEYTCVCGKSYKVRHSFLTHLERCKTFEYHWNSTDMYCKNCGKLMTERYASGEYCSPYCSRSFSSKIAKLNPETFKGFDYGRGLSNLSPYESITKEVLDSVCPHIKYVCNATRTQYTNIEYSTLNHRYRLDFYFPQLNLDLELDGRQHMDKDNKAHDLERDTHLKRVCGIETYRIKTYGKHEDKFSENLEKFIKTKLLR